MAPQTTRYYDPHTGRFLQTDPIGYADQMNLYAYVGNDPINMFDPYGEASWAVSREAGMGHNHAFIIITDDNNPTIVLEQYSFGPEKNPGVAGYVLDHGRLTQQPEGSDIHNVDREAWDLLQSNPKAARLILLRTVNIRD